MTDRKNQEQDRLTEHIRQLEAENNQLTGKLKAANREIDRMHKQVLLAKAAAKEAAENVGAMSAALYIGATLRYGIQRQYGTIEACFPFIDRELAKTYRMTMTRDDKNKQLTVRVSQKEEPNGHE